MNPKRKLTLLPISAYLLQKKIILLFSIIIRVIKLQWIIKKFQLFDLHFVTQMFNMIQCYSKLMDCKYLLFPQLIKHEIVVFIELIVPYSYCIVMVFCKTCQFYFAEWKFFHYCFIILWI